jgi:hypothetical protein
MQIAGSGFRRLCNRVVKLGVFGVWCLVFATAHSHNATEAE